MQDRRISAQPQGLFLSRRSTSDHIDLSFTDPRCAHACAADNEARAEPSAAEMPADAARVARSRT